MGFNSTVLVKAKVGGRRRQGGQSLVEFAISSIVLLLLMMGLLDLSRAFYFAVSLDGAAREGARHGAWFNTAGRKNIYLYDQTIWDTYPGGSSQTGSMGAAPPDNSWRLGDINVSLLMNFQLITPFIQSLFGAGINLAYNEHFTIQGKP